MTILSIEAISKQYAERPLFNDVTFGLERGERVAVIGVNGSGKTTLLRIAAGIEQPDSGQVVTTNGLKVAYLPQVPLLDERQTVLDAVFASDTPAIRLLHDYETTADALAEQPGDAALIERLAELGLQMDTLAAWDAEAAAKTVISKLGLAGYSHTPVGQLSGGLRKRVAMARALIEDPDLLILDEPTNHVDTATIAWLEQYLLRSRFALLLVTHDRYFLDRIVGKMIELDRGRVTVYMGNYASYLEQRAEREARAAAAEEAHQNLLRKELAWLRRGARARTTKQKSHVQRVYDLMEQRPDAPQQSVEIDLGGRRIGKRVLELRRVGKSFGERNLFQGLNLELQRNDRLGIIGPNGNGKSTLLNIIAGRITPDSGEVIVGETVHMAYYDQESVGLNEGQRVIDYVREAADQIRGREGGLVAAAQMLERFLFPHEAQWTEISRLSGGERRRLYLLRTLMFAPNLLLLDEPTNDLDIQTLTVLEDYLDSFNGAVVVVSHDRYFLDRTVQRLIVFEGEGLIREYPGGYSLYEELRAREEEEKPKERPREKLAAAPPPEPPGPRRLSYKERRELAGLEQQIANLEAQKASIEEQLNAAGADFVAYQRLAKELARISDDLERAFERWTELAELAE